MNPFLVRLGTSCAIAALALATEEIRVVIDARRVGDLGTPTASGAASRLGVSVALPIVAAIAAFAPVLATAEDRRKRAAVAAAFGALMGGLMWVLAASARLEPVRMKLALGTAAGVTVVTFLTLRIVRAFVARRPFAVPVLGLLAGTVAIELDARILPRLYPAMHVALAVVLVAAIVMIAEAAVVMVRSASPMRRTIEGVAAVGLVASVVACGAVPTSGRAIAGCEDTRRLLVEHSELLRPVVTASLRVFPPTTPPPPKIDDPLAPSDAPSPLDLRGRDILLLTLDAVRADHVGAYGYARRTTPSIDALAAEGAVFEHAYTAAPQTSWALTSMMTGKHIRTAFELEAAGLARPADETWAGIAREHGVKTAAFFPDAIFFTDRPRFAAFEARSFDFETTTINYDMAQFRPAQVAAFVADLPEGAPFFAWVHFLEPHDPYHRRSDYDFGPEDVDKYDSEIAYTDHAIGEIVSKVRAMRPDTVVIVTADHGEAFGEHSSYWHGTTLYEEQIRVPLVISAPGAVPKTRVASPVQTFDLLPTILAATGMPRPSRVRGRDLGPVITGQVRDDGVALARLPDASMIAVGSDRLICVTSAATCTLFDVDADPRQLSPILGASERKTALLATMHAVVSGNLAAERGAALATNR